jgi:hypothetical protein
MYHWNKMKYAVLLEVAYAVLLEVAYGVLLEVALLDT